MAHNRSGIGLRAGFFDEGDGATIIARIGVNHVMGEKFFSAGGAGRGAGVFFFCCEDR